MEEDEQMRSAGEATDGRVQGGTLASWHSLGDTGCRGAS